MSEWFPDEEITYRMQQMRAWFADTSPIDPTIQQAFDAAVHRLVRDIERCLRAALAAGQEEVCLPDPLVPGRHVVYDLRPALALRAELESHPAHLMYDEYDADDAIPDTPLDEWNTKIDALLTECEAHNPFFDV